VRTRPLHVEGIFEDGAEAHSNQTATTSVAIVTADATDDARFKRIRFSLTLAAAA
jgi:hypothetical protein